MFSCQRCKHRHHTLLHQDLATSPESTAHTTLITRHDLACTSPTVLLATAIVYVWDAFGRSLAFRAVFDTGSQNNFITQQAADRLCFSSRPALVNVTGLGGAEASINGVVRCKLGTSSKTLFDLDMLVIPRICSDQPIAKLSTHGWSNIKSLQLADPGFDIPGPIDILLGADIFAESLLNEKIRGQGSQPPALRSVFGWLLLGKTSIVHSSLLGINATTDSGQLASVVQRFWDIDNVPQASTFTPQEQLCEYKYASEHTRDPTGRYIVTLPFKDKSVPVFYGSRDIALRRFFAIERRLSRDLQLRTQYVDFMNDYLDSGHMSLVPSTKLGNGRYYIPHHGVLRPESTTTKLRVVFDASAKDYNGKSLNDTLLTGPKLHNDIFSILLRFREHKVVFMADVRQMYRQVLVTETQRDFQRVLWRSSPTEPIKEYNLNTVTYGTSAAPFLACRTLQQLAYDEGDAFPIAKQILLSDIYVDDVVTGCNSVSEAHEAKAQVINLFSKGHFFLRKWASNVPDLLDDIPDQHKLLKDTVNFDETQDTTLKVLGLRWEPLRDAFVFDVTPLQQPCTKRNILSELARIFDPLGFLSPLTIQAKCLIQKLWIIGTPWDETPPQDVIEHWAQYLEQLPQLKRIEIPRCVHFRANPTFELHGFCDASERAYGAVIYVRVANASGSARTFLHCAKARVAPIKKISLPRLELCAAVLLIQLLASVKSVFRPPLQGLYLWSDSMIVLSWLRSHSSRWVTFVANRVSLIQDSVPTESWRHVPTNDNPADICSRGLMPVKLLDNRLWWAGPSWLSQAPETWPPNLVEPKTQEEDIIQSEQRPQSALVTETMTEPLGWIDALFLKFSSLDKIINIIGYVRRFMNNTRQASSRFERITLTDGERHEALYVAVRFYQEKFFHNDIDKLKNHQALAKWLRKLTPFIDSKGILRVGGRISRSGLEHDHKHPALLPTRCPLTTYYITWVHRKHCHTGINTTHYLILQQFWIVAAKRVIRQQLSQCVRCFKTRPQPLQPVMSDLPSYRVNQVKAFSVVGVDFGGPFRIKLGKHRGAKLDKAYLCLFVCLTTKAVHLEVASNLSTDAFVAALRRFVARRGRCSIIHADCGTNFVGAKTQLCRLMDLAAQTERIEFKFNPPSAPHFGGVWEIQIKAAKSHMHRIVGDQVLTFEELSTLFTQIEAVLNSRPLCPISSDPNDLNVLTPGHFLTLEPLTSVPEHDFTATNLNRLNRWQLLQAFQQHFWIRWRNEYLHSLTQRAKWTKDSKPLPLNSIVIIKDDNRTPLQWSVGRVVNVHPGPDGVIRCASVRIANHHIITRPLVKLCPLPISAEQASPVVNC